MIAGGLVVNRLELDFTVGLSAATGRERDRRRVQVDVAVERRRRGRPARVDGQRASRRIEFRLTVDENARLEALARENGIPIAALIREAVNEFVADYAEDRRPFDCVR